MVPWPSGSLLVFLPAPRWRLLDDPTNITDNLHAYLRAFSPGAGDVLEKFDLPTQVDRLARADSTPPWEVVSVGRSP